MNIFISTFTGIIDNKNRITIPSNFKNTLKNAKEKIYAFKSLKNQCIEIYLENNLPLIVKYNVASLGEIKLCLSQLPQND